jgi:hypothetical protein
MRTTRRLLLLMIGLVSLTLGICPGTQAQKRSLDGLKNAVSGHPQDPEHASWADVGKRQEDGKSLVEGRNRSRRSGTNHPSSAASPKASAKSVSNKRQGTASGNAIGHHQSGSNKRGDLGKTGLNHGDTVHRSLHVRRAEVIRPTVPSLNIVRHRGANPAVIGGSAIPDRNTGAINGNRVHRKP